VAENRATLILFARAPVPGAVKTRLTAALGPVGAARLYRAFLEDAARVYVAGPWDPVLYADADSDETSLASIFLPPWRRRTQAPGDLGRRLAEAFRTERSHGAGTIAAVGSDHPALPRASLSRLFEAVRDGADAAVIPARDGGYCAIGLSGPVDTDVVFEGIPWSSATTLAATLERLRQRRFRVTLLDPAYDVDRPEDLERLRADLASRRPEEDDYPRSTAALLAAMASGRSA
jgi:rSAM/selenodomain-associated transferase 1